MIDRTHKLSVARQARLLGFSRGSPDLNRAEHRNWQWSHQSVSIVR